MPRVSRSGRRNIALLIWALGIMLFLSLGLWNLDRNKQDAENRMIGEAARMAGQIAAILAATKSDMDIAGIRSAINAVMDDDNVYAVKIETERGLKEGQRRNYLWEPVPWDDEIAENCIQGMNPIKISGHKAGSVEVWISPRLSAEEDALLLAREKLRFSLISLFWTTTFMLLFWQWGEFGRLRKFLLQKKSLKSADGPQLDVSSLHASSERDDAEKDREENIRPAVVDADAGRRFQRRHPDSWRVTAGMFRQTFARGPALISRLYAEGETAGLCHLGRMLEQAAPCVGADKLAQAAKAMQAALNDPDCGARAMPVEECAAALEEVLEALCGNGQWHSKLDCLRS